MLNRALFFFFLLLIMVIVGFNYKKLMALGQANEIWQSAKGAIHDRNWEKAIEQYQSGAKRYPQNKMLMTQLANLYDKNHQAGLAEKTYRRVLKLEPGNLDATVGLASFLEKQPNRLNETLQVLKTGLKKHPHEPKLLLYTGNLYKHVAERLAVLQNEHPPTPISDNPDDPGNQKRRLQKENEAHRMTWLYEQARYYYELTLRMKPDQFEAQFNLALAQQHLDNLQASAKAYCEALRLNPNSYESHYNLGLLLLELNIVDISYRHLSKALDLLTLEGKMENVQHLSLQIQSLKNDVRESLPLAGQTPPPSGPNPEKPPAFLTTDCLLLPPKQKVTGH